MRHSYIRLSSIRGDHEADDRDDHFLAAPTKLDKIKNLRAPLQITAIAWGGLECAVPLADDDTLGAFSFYAAAVADLLGTPAALHRVAALRPMPEPAARKVPVGTSSHR